MDKLKKNEIHYLSGSYYIYYILTQYLERNIPNSKSGKKLIS